MAATMKKIKPVLDACCGSKMFWFDRNDSRAVFLDKRSERMELNDVSSKGGKRSLVIAPDVVADFTNLPFAGKSFYLVIFDPPHFKRNGATGWIAKKYGTLKDNWREVISAGFAECFRVLKPNGVLIFKWNENEIKISEILALTSHSPLIGQRGGKHFQTHWVVFIKDARR
jgi:SAM-dependent methyltransferase